MVVCRWLDNNLVTMCSNKDQGFSQKEKKKVAVQQPVLIKEYNIIMGGVDRSDQNISLYRTSIRGKKWHFPLFAHCIDMAVTNDWQLHRLYGGKFTNLTFRRSIAWIYYLCLLVAKRTKCFQAIINRKCGLPIHWITKLDKRLRCRMCHKKASNTCTKCNVTLHVECFMKYHSKN